MNRVGRPANIGSRLPQEIGDALEEIGANLATARVRRGWRQSDLAAKAGVNVNTLRKAEAGAPGTSIATLASLLWAMGLLDPLRGAVAPANDSEGAALEAGRRGERVRLPVEEDDF